MPSNPSLSNSLREIEITSVGQLLSQPMLVSPSGCRQAASDHLKSTYFPDLAR